MDNITRAKEAIKASHAVLITAGAGMGVDSGLPDFRGDSGFWKAYPIIKDLGYSFSQMANPEWFERDPSLAWAFYGHRLHLYRETTPHDGFTMLHELVKKKNANYFIFTSNVDGQFQKAGFSDAKICEVHGSIHHLQCSKNCTQDIYNADNTTVDIDIKKFQAKITPLCPQCNAVARPNILMFGDWKWNDIRTEKQADRLHKWLRENKDKKIAIIELGAGTAVPTVRHYSEHITTTTNATLIRINPRESQVSQTNAIPLEFGALTGLKHIL